MIRPVLVVLALLLAAIPTRADEEPIKRLSGSLKKAIPKAFGGHERSLREVQEAGPLTRKAAEEVVEKVLRPWRFPRMKSGRDRREIEVNGRTMEYGLYAPKGYSSKRSWPLILSLHGAGGNGPGELNFIWSRNLSDWRGFVAAPSGQPPGAQWFPEQEEFVLAVLRDMQRSANIDTNRVYVQGFSNGGNGAWFYGENHPGLFAAMCTRGGGNPSPSLLVNLLHVPTYIIHGENDSVIRVDSDRRDAKRLEELGYEVVYKEVKGGGHKPFVEENPKVLDFFLSHPRDPWPKTLKLQAPTSKRFRNLWLEVPERSGVVTAEVGDGNRIEIQGAGKVVLWLSDALVDLDEELVVTLDGTEAFRGKVPRRLPDLLADLTDRFERAAPAFARLEVKR